MDSVSLQCISAANNHLCLGQKHAISGPWYFIHTEPNAVPEPGLNTARDSKRNKVLHCLRFLSAQKLLPTAHPTARDDLHPTFLHEETYSERSSDLSQVTQLVSGNAEIPIHTCPTLKPQLFSGKCADGHSQGQRPPGWDEGAAMCPRGGSCLSLSPG